MVIIPLIFGYNTFFSRNHVHLLEANCWYQSKCNSVVLSRVIICETHLVLWNLEWVFVKKAKELERIFQSGIQTMNDMLGEANNLMARVIGCFRKCFRFWLSIFRTRGVTKSSCLSLSFNNCFVLATQKIGKSNKTVMTFLASRV